MRTVGEGLDRGRYEGRLLIRAGGNSVAVAVTMTVGVATVLDPSERRLDTDAVPMGAWSSPFALPVRQVLNRPLTEVAEQLGTQSRQALVDVRVVAVTARGVLYVAAETRWNATLETRVWTSADGGATWNLLLRRQPNVDCQFADRLQAAALHPDGERVFLGVTDGLFLEDEKISGPPGLTDIDALHVSADGRYLYVATDILPGTCFRPGPTSDAGIYRGRFTPGSERLTWEGGRSELIAALAPLSGIGSAPLDPNVVYLRAASGALFRKVLGAAVYGWRRLDADRLPAGVRFTRRSLPKGRQFLRVPPGYAAESVPYVIDLHNSWAGLLFGRDGVVYGRYTGFHGGMYFDTVIASRDAGVSWFRLRGNSAYGTRPATLRFLDGRGLVSLPRRGSWVLDPIDPLTAFVFGGGGGDLISRSVDGRPWTDVGRGLPPAGGALSVDLDSLGTLYVRIGCTLYARSVATHPFRVTHVDVQPARLRSGDRARTTGDSPSRTSARASYQVVPEGDLTVFEDEAGSGWNCTDEADSVTPLSSAYVHRGARARPCYLDDPIPSTCSTSPPEGCRQAGCGQRPCRRDGSHGSSSRSSTILAISLLASVYYGDTEKEMLLRHWGGTRPRRRDRR